MREKEKSKIIFGYMNTLAYGRYGEDDGFSVFVYPDGKLVYKTYIFSEVEKTKTELKLSDDIVKEIIAVLEENERDINDFDNDIRNGSWDGGCNKFIFSGKEILTWNIEYHNEDELQKRSPDYYKRYLKVIRQQNKILILFSKLSYILEKQGIDLRIYEVYFDENS